MDNNNFSQNNNNDNEQKEQSYSYTPNTNYSYGYNSQPTPINIEPENTKRHFGLGTVVLCIVLSVIISISTTLMIIVPILQSDNDTASLNSDIPSSSTANTSGSSDQNSDLVNSNITISGDVESIVEAVYTKAANSCVGIRTKAWVESFFGGSTQSTGEGSGVIYSADGYIITNYHVISEVVKTNSSNSTIEVFLMSAPDDPIDAKIVGYNVSADLAVIKVEKTGLPAIETADTDSIKVGQYAIAIGCPGGIEFLNSVSYGTISGLNRTITLDNIGEMKLIQTDAAINPGNSGGALLNSKGQLIGINSSKLVDESFEGMGFAIPTKTVIEVVTEIIDNKDNPSPYIGIEIYKYDSDYLEKFGLPHGAAVKSVVSGAPAYNAGIRSGDIITSFNKTDIDEYTDFIDILDKCKPDTKVNVRIYRNGHYYSTTVTIGSNNSRG